MAEASYTIYLFHHLLVVAGGFALVYVDWPIGLKFVVLVAGVFASTAALPKDKCPVARSASSSSSSMANVEACCPPRLTTT